MIPVLRDTLLLWKGRKPASNVLPVDTPNRDKAHVHFALLELSTRQKGRPLSRIASSALQVCTAAQVPQCAPNALKEVTRATLGLQIVTFVRLAHSVPSKAQRHQAPAIPAEKLRTRAKPGPLNAMPVPPASRPLSASHSVSRCARSTTGL